MKFLSYGKDGGPESTVSGFWLIELKNWFSIVLLKFEDGSRDAFHSHAFHSVSWLLSGKLEEVTPEIAYHDDYNVNDYWPSLRPIITNRDTVHKVVSVNTSWVLSFRGPWADTWHEWLQGKKITLTNGRKEV